MENNQQNLDEHYINRALGAVENKKPLPEIDFTLHTMEDGSQVSTLERVCKGMEHHSFSICPHVPLESTCILFFSATSADPAVTVRCPSACLPPAYRGSIPVAARSHEAQSPVPEAAFLP
jgi:hypothetical protein